MIHLLARCGIGDIISHISRIEGIKKCYNDSKVKFWLGGYKIVPELCRQILINNKIDAEIIKGWQDLNQNEHIKKYIISKHEEDTVIDLNFEIDIFNNRIPDFYKYEMQFPFDYAGEQFEDDFFDAQAVIGIQAFTKTGAPDFDHAGKRFWSKEKWIELINKLAYIGYKVAIFGSEDDNIEGLASSGAIKAYCGKLNVNQTIYAIKKCYGFIGTNSWMWEVAAFSEIRTVCLYFSNTFFASLHIPYTNFEQIDNLYIETDAESSIEKVIMALDRIRTNINSYELIKKTNEVYEKALLINLEKYIYLNPDVKKFYVPRITIITDLDERFVIENNLKIHPMFNWVNYPDYQLAITTSSTKDNEYKIINLHSIRKCTKKEYLGTK